MWRVGIWSTVQTLDDVPHVWAVRIRHCIFKYVFPTFCLGIVDSLSGFTASIDRLLLVLMYYQMEAISCMDFGSHM